MGIKYYATVQEYVVENNQTGTSYTIVEDDQCKLITLSNASAITLTIPTNATLALPKGWSASIVQIGAGQVTVAGSGITFQSTPGLKLRAQYSTAWLVKRATDTWLVTGDLAA